MNHLLSSAIGLLALAAASSAQAQDVVDPIGSILDQVDEETAEAVGAPPPVATPPAPAPAFPYSPPSAPAPAERPAVVSLPPAYTPPPAPRRPRLTAPVTIDEYDKTPEAPLNAAELGYETRLRSSFASAQGMQGPMDGAWVLRGRSGETLYSFLLVDKGGGTLEGAWRDPRRRGTPEGSGFLVDIQRTGSQVTASFYPRPGGGVATLLLNPGPGGEWSGDLLEGRDRTAVTLRRN
ncbi:MAG: hypothetical protein C0481_20310 [Phenylobacterium sp.]|uniref:hypothetical protein n=1 Tax=Phenylobacterium sp. TaxID=1871053 RepID=UPI0025E6F637|nr:hypothetical protein [Phenylobacterium sp.]MBA4014209.1 hypothetical protein [Phenylobacterium sp.]